MDIKYLCPWFQTHWRALEKQWQQAKFPHALLLQGPEGSGRSDFVDLWAKRVLCESVAQAPCGNCRSCQLFDSRSHPDFSRIAPEDVGKSITVDAIRSLSEVLSQTAQRHHYQVAVIYCADSMNRAACNALLKTLEEPAGQVLMMLICERTATLPATIRSRCQHVMLSAQTEAALSWLKAKDPHVPWSLLLRLSNGAPLKALAFREKDGLALRDHVIRCFLKLAKQGINPLRPADYFIKQDVYVVFHLMLSILMDVAWLHYGCSLDIVHQDRRDPLLSLQQCWSLDKVLYFLEKTQQVWAELHRPNNLNAQLLLESLLFTFNEG